MRKKPRGFLEIVRQKRAEQNVGWSRGPLPPPVDLSTCSDFALGTWTVEINESRIRRGELVYEVDEQVLSALVLIAGAGATGIRRDTLCLQLYGPVRPENHPAKLRRITSFLRRVLGDDGSVRLLNTDNDGYAFETGAPVEGRLTLDEVDPDAPMRIAMTVTGPPVGRGRRRGLALGAAVAVVIGLAAVLILLVERREGILFGQVTATQALINAPGRQLSPSFSPDGTQLVYSWLKTDGSQKLYVRSLRTGETRRLTDGEGRDENPVWAPKGGQIAFTRKSPDGCAVMVVGANGADARRVGDCEFRSAGQMAWVRDGSALATVHRSAWAAPGQVILNNLGDGKSYGITQPTVGMPGDTLPALAPTGRRLAFVRARALGVEDLQVLEFESGKPVRMTFDQAPIEGTAWEQGGHSIVVASARRGPQALWRIRMDGWPAQRMIPSADPQRRPTVTEDGRQLAFEHWHVTTRFSRYGTSTDAEPVMYRRGVAMERALSFSADGARAVYLSNIGDKEAVYLAAMPDGVPRPLTRGSYDAIETPRLSPDGKQVVFAASTQGHLDVYLVGSDGAAAEVRIPGDGESRAPSWSRDGKSLYFSSNRNGKRWQIFRQTVGKPDAEQITDGGGLVAQESSDGQWLYFVRPDRKGLWQRSTVAGGDDQFLAGELSPIDWRNMEVARDAIWFVGRPAGDATLYRYVFAKGRVETGPVLLGLMPDSGLALLPSGREVVVSEEAETQVDIDLSTLQ